MMYNNFDDDHEICEQCGKYKMFCNCGLCDECDDENKSNHIACNILMILILLIGLAVYLIVLVRPHLA